MAKRRSKIIQLPFSNQVNYHAVEEREKNIVGSRIDEARKRAGLSLAEFSELLTRYGVTVSPSAINKWTMGIVVPNAYQLLAVCHALDLDVDVTYFCADHTPVLNEEGMEKVRTYRDDLIASGRYKPPVKAAAIRYVDWPVSNLAVSAGTGEFLGDGSFEIVSFPENTVPEGAAFGIRVAGDSMEPVYHDGQIVWVQPCEALSVGEIGIFIYDGQGYLKVYGEKEPDAAHIEEFTDSYGCVHPQPVMISDNQAYAPKAVEPETDFRIVGRVL